MATFVRQREARRANDMHYPTPTPKANKPGAGKRKRREIISFDVQLYGGRKQRKRLALIEVKTPSQAVVSTHYRAHAVMSHKALQIMGNRGKALSKPKRFKRWSSK